MKETETRGQPNINLEKWINKSESSEETSDTVAFEEVDEADIESKVDIMKKIYDTDLLYRYWRNQVSQSLCRKGRPQDLIKILKRLKPHKDNETITEMTKIAIEKCKELGIDLTPFIDNFEIELGVELPREHGKPRISIDEKVNKIIENIEGLIKLYGEKDLNDFNRLNTKEKVKIIYRILADHFTILKTRPIDPLEESVTYIVHNNVLYDVDEAIEPIVGVLISKGVASSNMIKELETATYSTGKTITTEQIDPWEMLNLANGVLDLMELKVKESSKYYFRHILNISISNKELDEIKSDSYEIEKNDVYRLWRRHFDDENWEHFVHSVGTWLSPYRHKHIGFLIGPTNSGKSTLLYALRKPIEPIVSNTDLKSLTNYQFGLESLIGRQIIAISERGETVLRNISIINRIMGEKDYILVHRKHKPPITIRSLKSMMVAMNDPPVVLEYSGGEFKAFINRLSLIYIKPPDDFKPIPNLEVDPKEAFKFLLWARRQLEKNNWVIKRKSDEDIMEILMREINPVLKFLEESELVKKDPSGRVKGKDLYDAYMKWSVEKGFKAVGLSEFYSIVGSKYQSYERGGATWFRGLRLVNK
jgi:phage/plasmid-associated DNA primase